MTENTKMNFFKKLALSVKDIDKYDQLAIQPIRKGISYFLKLILLFAVILSIVYTMQIFQLVNKAKTEINNIPDFKYENGEVSFEENKPIILEDVTDILNTVLILPEENDETKEYIAKAKTYKNYLIINKSNFVISINDNKLQYNYSDILNQLSIKSFDRVELKSYLDDINTINLSSSFFAVMILYLFFGYGISIAIDICLTFIISFLTTRLAKIRLKTSALINIAIHSLTLPVLLYLAYCVTNILTGFEISNFRIMYILIASVYSVISILIIKVDFIEKQVELAKVIKEQQEIRKELQEQEDGNNENKNKEHEEETINNENKEVEQQDNIKGDYNEK